MEEVKERLAKDLDACVDLLAASGRYLTGDTPCQADCFLFAIIDAVRPYLPPPPVFTGSHSSAVPAG